MDNEENKDEKSCETTSTEEQGIEKSSVTYDEPKPLILWLPSSAAEIENATVQMLVALVIKKAHDDGQVIKTQDALRKAIKQLSNGTRTASQSQVSKSITELESRVLNIKDKYYVLRHSREYGYQLLPKTYLAQEAHKLLKRDIIESTQLFRNNPTGISSVFGFKIALENHEEAKKLFSKMLPVGSLFGFIPTKDILFVLLDGSSKDFKKSADILRDFFM